MTGRGETREATATGRVAEKVVEKAAEKGVKIRIAAPLTKESVKAAKKLSKFTS